MPNVVTFTFSTQEKPGALFAISMPFHPSPLPTASSLSPDTAQCLRGGDASQCGARPSRHVPHTGHCRCSDQGRPHGISLHIPVDQGAEGVAFRSHMQIGALSLTAQGQERNHHSHTKPWRLGPGEGLPELGGLQASVSAEGERPPPEGQRGERGAGKRPEAPRTRFTEPHVPCSRGGKKGPLGSRVPGNGLSGRDSCEEMRQLGSSCPEADEGPAGFRMSSRFSRDSAEPPCRQEARNQPGPAARKASTLSAVLLLGPHPGLCIKKSPACPCRGQVS